MGLFDEIRQYRTLMDEAEGINELLKSHGEDPSFVRVAIPMAYRRLMEYNERKPFIPDHYVTALSFIIGREYPKLGTQLLTKTQKETLDAYRNAMKQTTEGHDEKK